MKMTQYELVTIALFGHIDGVKLNDLVSDTEVEVPEKWFFRQKHFRLAVGKERGFLNLTPEGWKANKNYLKSIFYQIAKPRVTWEQVEKDQANFYIEVDKATRKYKKELEAKIKQIEDYLA